MNILKSLLIIILSSSIFSTTKNTNFNSVYSGLQLGVTNTITAYIPDKDEKTTSQKKVTAATGGLFIGYGKDLFSTFYAGGEVYYCLTDGRTKHKYKEYELKHTNGDSFGIKLRLGYVINPKTLIYCGFGQEKNNPKTRYTYTNNRGEKVEHMLCSSKNNKYNSTTFFGTDVFLIENVFIRGEYTYIHEKKQKFTHQPPFPETKIRLKTNQHRFMLGVGYKF
jgi:opacity protein-like surface antigen